MTFSCTDTFMVYIALNSVNFEETQRASLGAGGDSRAPAYQLYYAPASSHKSEENFIAFLTLYT